MTLIRGAVYDGPARGYGTSGASKRYIAIHNTANDATPAGEASYAKRRTDSVSSHFYADPVTVIQSLDTKLDAWHAGSRKGNREAIAWELVGTNSWSEGYWRKVIDRIAPVVAEVCRVHNIPVQWATASDSAGFVTHDDMRRYWGGTTHTDPGPNFPRAYLIGAVKQYMGPTVPVVIPPKPAPRPPIDWTVSLIMALPTLKRGANGQAVKNAQGLLNAHGAKLTLDGDFGPATDSAVKSFQRAKKLTVDGEIGRNTHTVLITR